MSKLEIYTEKSFKEMRELQLKCSLELAKRNGYEGSDDQEQLDLWFKDNGIIFNGEVKRNLFVEVGDGQVAKQTLTFQLLKLIDEKDEEFEAEYQILK